MRKIHSKKTTKTMSRLMNGSCFSCVVYIPGSMHMRDLECVLQHTGYQFVYSYLNGNTCLAAYRNMSCGIPGRIQ